MATKAACLCLLHICCTADLCPEIFAQKKEGQNLRGPLRASAVFAIQGAASDCRVEDKKGSRRRFLRMKSPLTEVAQQGVATDVYFG